MTFENNFIHHSKEYIFLDNETLLSQRAKTFKKIFKNKIYCSQYRKINKCCKW